MNALDHFFLQHDFLIEKEEENQKHFQQRFEAVQNLFVFHNFRKIVLSTYKKIKYQKSFKQIFENLTEQFDQALVYFFYHPSTGIWVGATPEVLWKNDANSFHTMALAGTQKQNQSSVIWSEKEKIEHQMVVEMIEDKLKKAHFSYSKTQAENSLYGNLIHLRTHFSGILKKNFDLFEILDLLHPTPAVAGLPVFPSINFLLQKEPFRQFYTGFLGEVDIENTQIFVNLRCAHLDAQKAYLYAGAGITSESICENEWAEIQLKMQNLEKILIQ